MKSRKFTLECKWEPCDRAEEEPISIQHIEIPKLKNVGAEVQQAIAVADRILMASDGRGKITTMVISDASMKRTYAILRINQNEEAHKPYHCELSKAMQAVMVFLFHTPKLKLSGHGF